MRHEEQRMLYNGQTLSVALLNDGVAQLNANQPDKSVNTLNAATLKELSQALDAIEACKAVCAVVLTSSKDSFIAGADIAEFIEMFARPNATLGEHLLSVNALFSRLEDLDIPTVAAINGQALGGGFELALAADYRLISSSAKVGLPEVKLGIFPGFGGTVRLSRLIGCDSAIEWICTGRQQSATEALRCGAVDAVVESDQLLAAALDLLGHARSGEFDYRSRRAEKRSPVLLSATEQLMTFTAAKAVVAAQAGPHYPAPLAAVKTMERHAGLARDEAIAVEVEEFVNVAKTGVAHNLIALFLGGQAVKKIARKSSQKARTIEHAAVLGAGIMGGGIAVQCALENIPIVMKDINRAGLDAGLAEARNVLNKRVQRNRMDVASMATALTTITPTLSFDDFAGIDIVVEAVVEKSAVKQKVLAEVERHVGANTVITSNTSTISISSLATALQRPENFCGMHFFNPVHRMPLVEVIRGAQSCEQAIATTVAYALSMGKTPVVVNDCPGFFVNRVLFPYFGAFAALLRDGVDFHTVDRTMEAFGWPMGPAHLLDVVGLDTAIHAEKVLAEGFPDRMTRDFTSAIQVLYEQGRYGQKNAAGFYRYETDRRNRLQKIVDDTVSPLLEPVCAEPCTLPEDGIVARMMIPMCLEVVRCLEENIVASPEEADMSLVLGVGFPPFRGGAVHYIEQMGLDYFVDLCDKYSHLGALYQPTPKLRTMADERVRFYHNA